MITPFPKSWKSLLLPLSLLMIMLQLATFLIGTSSHFVPQNQSMREVETGLHLLVSILILISAHRIRLSSLLGWTLCLFAGVVGSIACLFLPLSERLGEPQMAAWCWAILRALATPTLASLLGWGAAVHLFSLREAGRAFFLLALANGTFGTLLPQLPLPPIPQPLWLATGVLFLALLLYKWLERVGSEERWEGEERALASPSIGKLAGIALLVAALSPAVEILSHLFAGASSLTDTSIWTWGVCLLLSLSALLIGPKLLQHFGWQATTLVPLALAGGATLLLSLLLAVGQANLMKASMFAGLLVGVQVGWLTPLAQMLFLSFPRQQRFALQAWTLLWLAPLVRQLGGTCIRWSLQAGGTWGAAMPLLLAAILLMVGVAALAAYRMGSRGEYREPLPLD